MKKVFRFLLAVFQTAMLDAEALFSNDQAITATADSTNVVDLGNAQGDGSNRTVSIHITETFATLTNLTIALEQCDTEGGSYTTVLAMPALTLASGALAAGQSYEIPVPKHTQQFLQLSYTVGGSDATAGKVTAGIVLAADSTY